VCSAAPKLKNQRETAPLFHFGEKTRSQLAPALRVIVMQQFAAILLLQWTYSTRIEFASLNGLCAVKRRVGDVVLCKLL
jgi:hypothetical protein